MNRVFLFREPNREFIRKYRYGEEEASKRNVRYRVPDLSHSLLQAVKRNLDRFPEDFMFQLSWEEVERMDRGFLAGISSKIPRSQFVILDSGKNVKYRPYAFSEQGVAMLSSVLRSKRAVRVNIEIVRAFVRLRGILAAHKGLAKKLEELEMKYDAQFRVVFDAIRDLMGSPDEPPPRIGFKLKSK